MNRLMPALHALWQPADRPLPVAQALLAAALGLAIPSVVLRSVPTFSLLVLALLLCLVTLPKSVLLASFKTALRQPLAWIVLAFLTFTAWTCHLALNPHYAWHFWHLLAIFAFVSALLVAVVDNLSVEAQRHSWRWLLVGFWLSLIVAMVIIVGEPAFERYGVYDAGNAWTQTRLRFYSSVLSVYLPFCWVIWLNRRPALPSQPWQHPMALVGLSLIGIVLCAGRAGWLGAAVSLPVTLWLLYRHHGLRLPLVRSTAILAAAGAASLLLYTVFYGLASVEERVGVVSTPRGLGGGRLDIWRMALQHIPDHPLTGIGLNNFRFIPGADFHPHNFVLQLLLETGLPGTMLAFALLGMLLTKLYRRTATSLPAVAGFAGLCGFMVAGLTNKSIFAPDWLIMLILVAVLGLCFKPASVPANVTANVA